MCSSMLALGLSSSPALRWRKGPWYSWGALRMVGGRGSGWGRGRRGYTNSAGFHLYRGLSSTPVSKAAWTVHWNWGPLHCTPSGLDASRTPSRPRPFRPAPPTPPTLHVVVCVCHLQVACEKTIATMQAVLKRTMDTAKGVIVRVLIEQQPMLRSYSYLVVSLGSHNGVIAK